jgi:putative nucleotidyltransferase with HDIG domain/PAS domain S-box-containing protein
MLRAQGSVGPKGACVSVRILFVEDSQDDVELQLRRLRDAELDLQWDRVESEEALRAALAEEYWHIALVDYNIPGFSGIEALRLIAELAPDLPAITVSGSIDEDTAVATMAAGAVDYVLKDNLTRLAPAVRRAVDGADLRRAHRRAAESASLALFAVDHASLSITTVAPDGSVVYVNAHACLDFAGERSELVGKKIWEVDPGMSAAAWSEVWDRVVEQGAIEFRVDRVQPDGQRLVLAVTVDYLEGADLVISYGRDVTKRVAAEEALDAERSNLAAIFESSPVAMVVFDAQVNVVRVNRAALCLVGPAGEGLLEHWPESRAQCGDMVGCVHSTEDERGCGFSAECPLCPLRNAVRAAIAGAAAVRGLELSLEVARDGRREMVWLRMGAESMVMDGAPHVTVALDDITDRYRAQLALAESDERFRSLAEQVPGFVTIKDSDGRYLYLSSLWGAVDESGPDVWLGKRAEEVWPPAEAAISSAAAERALAGEMVDEVTSMQRAEEVKYFHSLHFPIARDGAPPLVGGLMIDVTDQVEAQEEVRRQAEQLRRTVEGAVLAMSQVVETRDPYTAGHERRVAELATAVGRDLELTDAELDGLRLGSLIHDIGKIAVPAEILAKPGRLSTVEFNLIKQHAQSGYEILSVIDFGRPVADMVLQHHERMDGSGYPNGLTGEQLLLETRILSVADVVEAMSSHRPYRAALGVDAALAEIRQGAGVLYDREVAAACERVMVEQGFRFTP